VYELAKIRTAQMLKDAVSIESLFLCRGRYLKNRRFRLIILKRLGSNDTILGSASEDRILG
jgi:hypothetical protein